MQVNAQPSSQPPPTVYAGCAECKNPVTTPYNHDPVFCAAGDIIRLQESIHAPVESILRSSGPSSSAAPRLAIKQNEGKQRPAVVIKPFDISVVSDAAAPANRKLQTCLMATYDGTYTFERLPRVLKHFCLPISPHPELHCCPEHVHTIPQWQGSGWFIAVVFVSTGAVTGRWLWSRNGRWQKDSSFRIDLDHLEYLIELCRQKQAEWQSWCQEEPRELERCKEEYIVSLALRLFVTRV